MYIEFKLPTGQRIHYRQRIESSIELWLARNAITDYDIRTHVNNSHRLAFTLSEEQLYTLFLLSWNEPNLPTPKLVVEL